MNILKTSAQAEIEIRMIDTTYIALIAEKRKKHVIIYTILCVWVSLSLQHGKIKVEEPNQPLFILQVSTYKKSKQENKENVSNNGYGGMQADSIYMKLVN